MGVFSEVVLYFSLTAFLGWILEMVFRSVQQRQLVNPGFLQGPFVMVYGFGALGIYVVGRLLPFERWGIWAWVIVLLLPSVVEYVAGWFMEVFFRLKMWDYSHLRFHLHGRVCLLFSLLWGALAVVTVLWIQPFFLALVRGLSVEWRWFLTGALCMYFSVDVWFSAGMYKRYAVWTQSLKDNIAQFSESLNASLLSLRETQRYFRRLFHPLRVFPHLAKQLKSRLPELPEPVIQFLRWFLPKE